MFHDRLVCAKATHDVGEITGTKSVSFAVLLGLYALMYDQIIIGVIFFALWFSTIF